MMTNNTIGMVLGTVLDLGLAWYWYVTTLAVMVLLSSLVLIRERQAGIVVKRFAGKSLEPGHLIALAGEQRKTYEVQEAAQKQRQQLVRQTSLADIQQEVVGAEQGVNIAELKANASVKQASGDAESTRLRALGESEAIRATGKAKAEAYRAGVESIGAQGYTVMQLMQIVGERNVRIVPDVAVNGAGGSIGLVEGLLGVMLRSQTSGPATTEKN